MLTLHLYSKSDAATKEVALNKLFVEYAKNIRDNYPDGLKHILRLDWLDKYTIVEDQNTLSFARQSYSLYVGNGKFETNSVMSGHMHPNETLALIDRYINDSVENWNILTFDATVYKYIEARYMDSKRVYIFIDGVKRDLIPGIEEALTITTKDFYNLYMESMSKSSA